MLKKIGIPLNKGSVASLIEPQAQQCSVVDISRFVGTATVPDDDTKYKLIKERVPSNGFKFPAKVYKDKRKLSGIMHRYCQRECFDIFKFISYSRLQDGLYCFCCVLFPTPSPHGQPSLLVKQPYSNWKDAKSDLKIHGVCWYHKDAEARMDAFVSTMVNPEKRIDLSLSSKAAEQVTKNREFLKSVLKCIEFCGCQGIALKQRQLLCFAPTEG